MLNRKLWDRKGEQDVGNYFQIIGFANAILWKLMDIVFNCLYLIQAINIQVCNDFDDLSVC
jgi:hypothetical protein